MLYCHGAPGAPAEIEQFHGADIADQLGVRLVVVARPGLWHSDRQPERRIVDWCEDAARVADACGLAAFGLLGYSAGASYAAAVAAAMPERVTAAALVAPVDHSDRDHEEQLDSLSLWAQRQTWRRPRLARAAMRATLATPAWRPMLRAVLKHTPLLKRPDHLALRDDEVLESVVRKAEQAFLDGVLGPQEDMALMMQPWGFDPSKISVPVGIWQGTLDTIGSTVAMATSLHERIRASRLTIVADGHLSTMTNHAADILAWVAGRRAVSMNAVEFADG